MNNEKNTTLSEESQSKNQGKRNKDAPYTDTWLPLTQIHGCSLHRYMAAPYTDTWLPLTQIHGCSLHRYMAAHFPVLVQTMS